MCLHITHFLFFRGFSDNQCEVARFPLDIFMALFIFRDQSWDVLYSAFATRTPSPSYGLLVSEKDVDIDRSKHHSIVHEHFLIIPFIGLSLEANQAMS